MFLIFIIIQKFSPYTSWHVTSVHLTISHDWRTDVLTTGDETLLDSDDPSSSIYITSFSYGRSHQMLCFKAAWRLHTPLRATLSLQYSVAIFNTLLVMSCLHSPEIRYKCCNTVRFCCGLEASNLFTPTTVEWVYIWCYYLTLPPPLRMQSCYHVVRWLTPSLPTLKQRRNL
jgi:hypothetical protein